MNISSPNSIEFNHDANFLYYNTPSDQLKTQYPNVHFPFKMGDLSTQLPKYIAIIRAVASIAFASYIAFHLTGVVFFWPVVIAGAAFSGWTIYSHICSKDAMIEAFYKIFGGKDNFEQLPEINLKMKPNENISEALLKLEWANLKQAVGRAKTLDGRNVVIIRALTRYNEGLFDNSQLIRALTNNKEGLFHNCQTQAVLAFVEKVSPYDLLMDYEMPLHELILSVFHAIFLAQKGNTFGKMLMNDNLLVGENPNPNNEDPPSHSLYCAIYSSIPQDMANEFFAQMTPT